MGIFKYPNIIINERIDKVLSDLDTFINSSAKWKDRILKITSAVRTPESQLIIIGKYAAIKGITSYKLFPEFNTSDVYGKTVITTIGEVYTWQRTWSRLLSMGIVINPPIEAKVLEDYFKIIDGKKVNRKGSTIPTSPHIKGTAFDISGTTDMKVTVQILADAQKAKIGIRDWLVERENNAVHVDIC